MPSETETSQLQITKARERERESTGFDSEGDDINGHLGSLYIQGTMFKTKLLKKLRTGLADVCRKGQKAQSVCWLL